MIDPLRDRIHSRAVSTPQKRRAIRLDATATLRRLYFSATGQIAQAHGVTIEDIQSRLGDSLPQAGERWLGDLVLAIGCERGRQESWGAVRTAHAWRLREALSDNMNPVTAGLLLERFWHDLARATRGMLPGDRGLRSYDAERPLARWLSARMAELIAREQRAGRGAPRTLDRRGPRHTLGIPVAAEVPAPSAT